MTIAIVALSLLLVYALAVAVGFFYKPAAPTALLGFIFGNLRREAAGGLELIQSSFFNLLFFTRPVVINRASGPLRKFAVTHIQYWSRFGWFFAWPMCFYFWIQFRFQKNEPNPNRDNDPANPTLRIPGTERGIYFRLPGWRWDAYDSKYIFTKGQFGFHLD